MLGNSSIIRYSQLFKSDSGIRYYANRGVSGIDGTLSTAAGLAMAADRPLLAIIGDLGFLYDSNALWNRDLPANLRILVINNGGGGIFRILKGPSDHPAFAPFVQAHHPADMGKLAEAFGLAYFLAEDAGTMITRWNEFMEPGNRASILEIRTDAAISAEIFRKLMSSP
jgi:2-succinyl-5-enolpyruvyl-6-hydroxy-3-cyclohexene-1-carboxylate synthase